jgi:hypothetical protein
MQTAVHRHVKQLGWDACSTLVHPYTWAPLEASSLPPLKQLAVSLMAIDYPVRKGI